MSKRARRFYHWIREAEERTIVAGIIACVLAIMVLLALASRAAGSPQLPTPDPLFAESVPCPPRGITIDGEIVRVIDGDTVVVRTFVEYRVRLLDCWAPETHLDNRVPEKLRAAEKARGLQAKSRMQELCAAGTAVRVHMPNSSADLADAITMGRLLGRVWRMADGAPEPTDLSAIMVGEGHASTTKREEFAPFEDTDE